MPVKQDPKPIKAAIVKSNIVENIFIIIFSFYVHLVLLAANVLQLPEGGDFGVIYCQPSSNFDRSTKLD